MRENNNDDTKCAPGKIYENDSCISLQVLVNMAEAYNKTCDDESKKIVMHPTFILNVKKYKKYLVREFDKLYSDKCTDQICWTKQEFVKKMDESYREELKKLTFRPKGPEGKFEWLTTFNINDVVVQYENVEKRFKFLGAVPIDFNELPELGIRDINFDDFVNDGIDKIGIIFNLDESNKPGSHWVASFIELKKGEAYFFDSVGQLPEARIRNFMRKCLSFSSKKYGVKPYARHNTVQHQHGGTECGVYSINFILRMLEGEDFEKICSVPTPDKVINKCRRVYFINVNVNSSDQT
jgi:hypothetical protein